jgi:hypothetical protein
MSNIGSNVVKFPSLADRGGMGSMYRRHRVKREARAREIGTIELTETAQNSRLRDARKNAWHEAQTRTEYFHRRMEFECVVGRMQAHGLPEGFLHPAPMHRNEAVKLWRAALFAQFLLPAPSGDCVTWKKGRLAVGEIERAGMTRERAQSVIDADVAWLAAHPKRKPQVPMSDEKKQERRNFKEAMRRRIKEIAASRDIPDYEIRPVLSLRHHLIAEFTENYNVNVEWLLEGKGRIFKKDQQEFAAVVTTLPMADQQAISTMVRELLQERDQ